ncbi:MAG: carbohydrate kinase family protein [Methermicoccaceae archaeon]
MQSIAVLGHTAVDFLMSVDTLPEPNSSVPVKVCIKEFGGGAANICTGIAKLGGKCTLVSSVGDDFLDSEYMHHLEEMGIELELHIAKAHTSRAYMMTDVSGNQMTFFYWGASSEFERMAPKARDAIHMATGDPKYNAEAAKISGFASFDPGQDLVNYDADALDAVLSNCNMLTCNKHEMARILNMLDTSIDGLLEHLDTVIVTKDREGSVVYSNGESVDVPPVSVDVNDPTGAGDGYRSGLFTALQKGYDLLSAAKVGSVVASFVIEARGAQRNQPSWDKMMERLVSEYGKLPEPER